VLQQIDQIANGLIEADPTSSRNKTFSEPSVGIVKPQIDLWTKHVIWPQRSEWSCWRLKQTMLYGKFCHPPL
jgi:hypothetical protein